MLTMLSETYEEWLPWLGYVLCVYAVLSLLRKSWRRIRQYAKYEIETEKLRKRKIKEAQQINKRIERYTVPRRKTMGGTQMETKYSQSSLVNNNYCHPRSSEEGDYRKNIIEQEKQTALSGGSRGTYSVSKIANEYERRSYKQKIHVASPQLLQKRHTLSFFEGLCTIPTNGIEIPLVDSTTPSNAMTEKRVNSVETLTSDEEDRTNSESITPVISNGYSDTRNSMKSSIKETLAQMQTALSNSLSSLPIGDGTIEHLSNNNLLDSTTTTIPTNIHHQYEVIKRPKKTQVETVEEILLQQRFSRSLSSYSITDLLLDTPIATEANIDQIIDQLH